MNGEQKKREREQVIENTCQRFGIDIEKLRRDLINDFRGR